LKPFRDDRQGQYNNRINDRWRLIFVWHAIAADKLPSPITTAQGETPRPECAMKFTPAKSSSMTSEAYGNHRPSAGSRHRCAPRRINDLVNGLRLITADTALRLVIFLLMKTRLWINLQVEFDLCIVERQSKAAITR
jgi:hypothetical protein